MNSQTDVPIYLWKIGIGEPTQTTPAQPLWILAPDLPTAHATAERYLQESGWADDTPLNTVIRAELVSVVVLASANVFTEPDAYVSWIIEDD